MDLVVRFLVSTMLGKGNESPLCWDKTMKSKKPDTLEKHNPWVAVKICTLTKRVMGDDITYLLEVRGS